MSATNSFETGILNLIFKNTTYANVGDSTGLVGSTTAGSLYISLHTSNPGEGGDQTTDETAYSGYARIAVVRSGSGWTVSGATATNAATITFGSCASGTDTLTHFGIGRSLTSTGELYFSGALTTPLSVSTGVQPLFAGGALTVTAD